MQVPLATHRNSAGPHAAPGALVAAAVTVTGVRRDRVTARVPSPAVLTAIGLVGAVPAIVLAIASPKLEGAVPVAALEFVRFAGRGGAWVMPAGGVSTHRVPHPPPSQPSPRHHELTASVLVAAVGAVGLAVAEVIAGDAAPVGAGGFARGAPPGRGFGGARGDRAAWRGGGSGGDGAHRAGGGGAGGGGGRPREGVCRVGELQGGMGVQGELLGCSGGGRATGGNGGAGEWGAIGGNGGL